MLATRIDRTRFAALTSGALAFSLWAGCQADLDGPPGPAIEAMSEGLRQEAKPLRALIARQVGGLDKMRVPAEDAAIPLPPEDPSRRGRYETTEAKRYLGKLLFHDPVRTARVDINKSVNPPIRAGEPRDLPDGTAFGGTVDGASPNVQAVVNATKSTGSCGSCHLGEAAGKAGTALNFNVGGEGRGYTDENGDYIIRRRPQKNLIPRPATYLPGVALFEGDTGVDALPTLTDIYDVDGSIEIATPARQKADPLPSALLETGRLDQLDSVGRQSPSMVGFAFNNRLLFGGFAGESNGLPGGLNPLNDPAQENLTLLLLDAHRMLDFESAELQEQSAERGLSASRLADQAEGLTGLDLQRHVVHRTNAAPGPEQAAWQAELLHEPDCLDERLLRLDRDLGRSGGRARDRARLHDRRTRQIRVPAGHLPLVMTSEIRPGSEVGAGGLRPGRRRRQPGLLGGASGSRLRAARVKAATTRKLPGARARATDGRQVAGPLAVERDHRLQEPSGVRMQWTRKERVHGRLLDHPARIHHHDAVGDLGGDSEIVGDEDHRHPGVPLQVLQQQQDLRLDRDVERGGRLVRHQQVGAAGQRHGDHRPLPHATRELVRVLPQLRLRVGDVHPLEQGQRLAPGLGARDPLVPADDLHDLIPDGEQGIEGGHGFLEHHRDAPPAQGADLGRRQGDEIAPVESHLPARDLRAPVAYEPQHRQRRQGLAAPGLPHQADGLACSDPQADLAHHLVRSALALALALALAGTGGGREGHREPIDLEQCWLEQRWLEQRPASRVGCWERSGAEVSLWLDRRRRVGFRPRGHGDSFGRAAGRRTR